MPDILKETEPNADAAVTETQAEPMALSTGSTLIKFPGMGNTPRWRMELRERVREFQQRKAHEMALKGNQFASDAAPGIMHNEREARYKHLGLASSAPATPDNPLVVAALRRIERARQRHVTARQSTSEAVQPSHVTTQTEQSPAKEYFEDVNSSLLENDI